MDDVNFSVSTPTGTTTLLSSKVGEAVAGLDIYADTWACYN